MADLPEQIWFLMSRSLSGEATAEERAELRRQLQEQPQLMQQYEVLRQLWEGNAGWQEAGPADDARVGRILQLSAAETALQRADDTTITNGRDTKRETIQTPARLFRLRPWKKVYGRVAIVAGLATGLWTLAHWYAGSRRETGKREIVAGLGSKTRTILPDGSTVWLNAGSRIRYEPGFSGPQREVTLQGEAFFDVVSQPSRPFIVHAGDLAIRVLGTAFNVKSYDEDTAVETTLIRGLVQITGNGQQAPVLLHPHQKILLPRKEPGAQAPDRTRLIEPAARQPRIVAIDSSMKEDERVETSWVYNRLEFRGDNFGELARRLERWYNIEIHFDDEAARALTFNGSLENETVEQAFRALQAAVPFRFTIKDNEVYIKSAEKTGARLTH